MKKGIPIYNIYNSEIRNDVCRLLVHWAAIGKYRFHVFEIQKMTGHNSDSFWTFIEYRLMKQYGCISKTDMKKSYHWIYQIEDADEIEKIINDDIPMGKHLQKKIKGIKIKSKKPVQEELPFAKTKSARPNPLQHPIKKAMMLVNARDIESCASNIVDLLEDKVAGTYDKADLEVVRVYCKKILDGLMVINSDVEAIRVKDNVLKG